MARASGGRRTNAFCPLVRARQTRGEESFSPRQNGDVERLVARVASGNDLLRVERQSEAMAPAIGVAQNVHRRILDVPAAVGDRAFLPGERLKVRAVLVPAPPFRIGEVAHVGERREPVGVIDCDHAQGAPLARSATCATCCGVRLGPPPISTASAPCHSRATSLNVPAASRRRMLTRSTDQRARA